MGLVSIKGEEKDQSSLYAPVHKEAYSICSRERRARWQPSASPKESLHQEPSLATP